MIFRDYWDKLLGLGGRNIVVTTSFLFESNPEPADLGRIEFDAIGGLLSQQMSLRKNGLCLLQGFDLQDDRLNLRVRARNQTQNGAAADEPAIALACLKNSGGDAQPTKSRLKAELRTDRAKQTQLAPARMTAKFLAEQRLGTIRVRARALKQTQFPRARGKLRGCPLPRQTARLSAAWRREHRIPEVSSLRFEVANGEPTPRILRQCSVSTGDYGL